MKNVMSWNTTSKSGVRSGSARISFEALADTSASPRQGWSSGALGRLGLGRGVKCADGAVGHLGGFHRDLGDPVAEQGVEEDRRDRQRDAL